jgi:predicted metal-dependent peptidase
MGCVLKITQGNYQVKMDNTVPKNELKVTICVIMLLKYPYIITACLVQIVLDLTSHEVMHI